MLALRRFCASRRVVLAAFILVVGSAADAASGYRFDVLHSFDRANNGPAEPRGKLVEDGLGTLYGVTSVGGHDNLAGGTIFKFTDEGQLTVLHEFDRDTEYEPVGLILATDGNLYGTAGSGGPDAPGGAIFRVKPSGKYSVLYRFDRSGGYNPESRPIQGRDGHLYGTTYYGGSNQCGVIYRLTLPELQYTELAEFGHGHGGCGPSGNLLQGQNGILYGTTDRAAPNFGGTVFRYVPSLGKDGLKVQHTFSGNDGASPVVSFTSPQDGFLYGTTARGGELGGGTGFKINRTGYYRPLHNYGGGPEGDGPVGGVTPVAHGVSIGETYSGGLNGRGTLYAVAFDDLSISVLHDMDPSTDGWNPAGLIVGSDNAVYGTNALGGAHGGGTIFKLVRK